MSNLSNIGFGIKSRNELGDLIEKAIELGRIAHAVPNEGIAVVYTDKSGAELWIKINEDNELTAFSPHFRGQSKLSASLTTPIYLDSSSPNPLCHHAWVAPSDANNPTTGLYPLVFNVADFFVINHTKTPQNVQIQLVAFPYNLRTFATEEEFENSQNTDVRLSSRLFIPTGLFAQKQTPQNNPEPLGMIVGIIKDWKKCCNDLTQQTFYWLLVETYGGEMDLVADTQLLPIDPQIGGVVQAECWLSGQIR